MLAADSTVLCQRDAGTALLRQCLPTTYNLTCPAGNSDAKMEAEFATSEGVMCKACSFNMDVKDKDPAEGKFQIALQFGDLMTTTGTNVAGVTAYEVHLVDETTRRSLTKMLTVKAVASNCCKSGKYMVVVRGDFAKNTKSMRIGVRPINVVVTSGGSTIIRGLPFTDYTNVITDVTVGQVKKVSGSVGLAMSSAHAQLLVAAGHGAKTVLAKSLADSIEGVSAEDVYIHAIYINDVKQSLGRRLAAATVKVDYTITTTPEKTITAQDIVPTKLQKAVQTQAAAVGVALVVTAAPTVSNPVSKTEGKPTTTAKPSSTPSSTTGKPATATTKPPAATAGAISTLVFPGMAAIIIAGFHLLL
jgi:hypothetical protein